MINFGIWYDFKIDKQNLVYAEYPFTFFIKKQLFILTLRGEYTKKMSNVLRPTESNLELEFKTFYHIESLKYISLEPVLRVNSLKNFWGMLTISFSKQ